jgi:hypothetical protein
MNGKVLKNVMLDMLDAYVIEGDVQKKLDDFRKRYFKTVEKALEIMPPKREDRRSSHFWKVGKLLYDFNESVTNRFEITNYTQAIIRDFGLYDRSHLGHIIQFSQFFSKKEISDSIPMSTYLELVRKANVLKKSGLFEKEKERLLKMSKDNALLPHKKYRDELNDLTKSVQQKSKDNDKTRVYKRTLTDYF